MNKQQLLEHLRDQGYDDRVLSAFEKINRESFVPPDLVPYAYEDIALPLSVGSTISQPSTIAFMLQKLEVREHQKILEIGSGSGYVLALLHEMTRGGEIYGIEILPFLVQESRDRLIGEGNIHIIHRDGANGLLEKSPFDRILVSAAMEKIPDTLLDQLTPNGILVGPVRNSIIQVKKDHGETHTEEYTGFLFVPLQR